MRLSRLGYGSYKEIEELAIDKFFNLIHYEAYQEKYKESFRQLNRKK